MTPHRYPKCECCTRFMERDNYREEQLCEACRVKLFGEERGWVPELNRDQGAWHDRIYHGDHFEQGEW